MAELGKKPRGQMSESMLTAVFIILSGGLQDAYTYLCRGKVFANALVSFVCAMQVQTFRKVRGHAYASTMCIGNMRSGTEALCVYLHTHDREVLRKALTYFGVIGLFAVGAGFGALLTRAFAERGIWVSCALLTVSFLIMFIRGEEKG